MNQMERDSILAGLERLGVRARYDRSRRSLFVRLSPWTQPDKAVAAVALLHETFPELRWSYKGREGDEYRFFLKRKGS